MKRSGLCSISFRNLSCEEVIDICDKAKIQCIEWGSDVHLPIDDPEKARKVKALCEQKGILTPSYGTYFECDTSDGFEAYCKIAKILEADTLRVWTGTKNREDLSADEKANLVRIIQECADIAKRYGQRIGFEYHHTTCSNSPEAVLELLGLVNRENVATYYQPRYWNKEPLEYLRVQDNLRDIQALKKNVINVHCYQWDKNINRLPLSDGFYQWGMYLDAFDDVNVYLEFVQDDSVENFYRDAKTLNEIIAKANGKPEPDLKEFAIDEVAEAFEKADLTRPYFAEAKTIRDNPFLKERIELIKSSADAAIQEGFPCFGEEDYARFFKDGVRGDSEARYFKRRKQLGQLALASYFSDDPKYLDATVSAITSICKEYSWVIPAHFDTVHAKMSDVEEDRYRLEIASGLTVGGLAECITILKDKLPKEVYDLAVSQIKRRAFDVLKYRVVWKDEVPTDNWAVISGGGVIIAALLLVHDPHRLAEIVTPCLNACIHYYWSFAEDGMIKEGAAGYWNFGIGMFVVVADFLRTYSNGKIDFFSHPKFKNIATCLSKVTFNNNLAVTFADSEPRYEYLYGIMARLQEIYGDDVKAFDTEKNRTCYQGLLTKNPHIPFLIAEFFYAKPLRFSKIEKNSYFLKDAEWLIMTSDNDVLFACKGGCTYEPHCHLDIGTFLLLKGNEAVLPDFGAGQYDRAYWDEATRYDDVFVVTSKSHNVPIINGHYQLPGHECRSENTSYDGETFSTNIEKAYGKLPELISLRRRFAPNKTNGNLKVNDEFSLAEDAVEIKERIVSYAEPKILDDAILITTDCSSLLIGIDIRAVIETKKVTFPDRSGKMTDCYTTDFVFKLDKGVTNIGLRFEWLDK